MADQILDEGIGKLREGGESAAKLDPSFASVLAEVGISVDGSIFTQVATPLKKREKDKEQQEKDYNRDRSRSPRREQDRKVEPDRKVQPYENDDDQNYETSQAIFELVK